MQDPTPQPEAIAVPSPPGGQAQESGACRLTPKNTLSDRDDADSRVASAQQFETSRIVRQDEASAEPDRRGDHKGVDGQLAPSVGIGEEVSSVAGDKCPGRHHTNEPLGEHPINRFVMALTSVELDQDSGRNAHRVAPSSGRTQPSPNQLVPAWVLSGKSERRESFAVEDQDGPRPQPPWAQTPKLSFFVR